MFPRTRDATHQATNRQRRRLQAQDRLDRDRRQAQPAAEARLAEAFPAGGAVLRPAAADRQGA